MQASCRSKEGRKGFGGMFWMFKLNATIAQNFLLLCQDVTGTTPTSLLQDAYAKFVKEFYSGTEGVSAQSYNQKSLKNTAITEDSSDRLWWFQVCTEVAYFQVAPSNGSIRSSKVDTRQSSYFPWSYSLSC